MSKTAVTQLRDAEGVSRANLFRIEVDKIDVEPDHNPRDYRLPENRAHLDKLKLSIRQHGVETPVKVRFSGGKILLVDGECRWRSCLEILAEEPDNQFARTLPATNENGDEVERLRVALTANDGKPLSEWELGNGYKRFLKMGKDEAWIAKELGLQEANVRKCIELADAPLAVKELLSELAVTPAAALHAVRMHGDGASFVLKSRVEENRSKAASKKGKKGKPAKAKPVAAPKKQNGVFVPFKTLTVLRDLFVSLVELPPSSESLEMSERGRDLIEKLLPKKEDK